MRSEREDSKDEKRVQFARKQACDDISIGVLMICTDCCVWLREEKHMMFQVSLQSNADDRYVIDLTVAAVAL